MTTTFETDADLDKRLLRCLSLKHPKMAWQLSQELGALSMKVTGRLKALRNIGRAKLVMPRDVGMQAFPGDPTGLRGAWIRVVKRRR